jgi:hypothetical protein
MMPTVETIIWLKEHNIEYKEITVKEAFEAGTENGFELLRGSWITYNGKTYPVAACFLGQVAINKGIAAETFTVQSVIDHRFPIERHNLYDQLNQFVIPEDSKWVIPSLVPSMPPLPRIARELGRVITHWNDDRDDETGYYFLETYQDIVDMAREVMTPFFEEKLFVISHDYRVPTPKEEIFAEPF